MDWLMRVGEKAAALGSVVAAASCPACFPAIASLGAAAGLGFLSEYEGLFITTLLPWFAGIPALHCGRLPCPRGAYMMQSCTAPKSAPILESVLTCPHCGHAKQETMPLDACLFFYECESCKTVLRPNTGDCCVFCSFASRKCPSMQEQAARGAGKAEHGPC